MSELVRAFIALPLPSPLLRATLAAQEAIRARAASSKLRPRFVQASQLHVTAKFLGDVDQQQIEGLAALLTQAAAETPVLRSRLAGATAFPSPVRARVIVAKLTDEEGLLGRLAARIEQAAVGLGVPADKRAFRPHVTVARLKRPGNVSTWLDVPIEHAEPTAFDKLVLLRSVLSREGPSYTVLESGALSPSGSGL